MKALTVRQPWAWAILHGGKDVENRSRPTHHRGLLAIHAGVNRAGGDLPRGVRIPDDDELVYGAILGVVDVLDVVESRRSKWFGGPYGWLLGNPIPLSKPVPCMGMLGLWNVSADVKRLVRRRLKASSRASGASRGSRPRQAR